MNFFTKIGELLTNSKYMGMLFQGAGGASVCMNMLCFSAEGFSGNADARQLQAPEHRQNHYQGKCGNCLPNAMPICFTDMHLFQNVFGIS